MTRTLWQFDSVTLRGRSRARLDGITLTIGAGRTTVIGYSGAGKTSILNLLVGLESPTAGNVRFAPGTTTRLPVYWVPQTFGLWPDLTVWDHLGVARSESTSDDDLDKLITDFDLSAIRGSTPQHLSLGESARVSVARALATDAQVLVMDEPLAHVDPARRDSYWDVIMTHCQGRSLVLATHAPETALRAGGDVLCLKSGQLIHAGPVSALYEFPPTRELARFLGAVNWFDDEEWLSQFRGARPAHACVRPEQLRVELTEADSPLTVVDVSFRGAIEEVLVSNAMTGNVRPLYHRPHRPELRPGDLVSMSLAANKREVHLDSGPSIATERGA